MGATGTSGLGARIKKATSNPPNVSPTTGTTSFQRYMQGAPQRPEGLGPAELVKWQTETFLPYVQKFQDAANQTTDADRAEFGEGAAVMDRGLANAAIESSGQRKDAIRDEASAALRRRRALMGGMMGGTRRRPRVPTMLGGIGSGVGKTLIGS